MPIPLIAQALGINAHYLKERIAKLTHEPVSFAPIKVSCPALYSIEFQSKNDKTITIRFQASTKELTDLIHALG